MTIINPNSIAGITSVTAEAGVMNFYKSDGTLAGLQLNGVNFNTTSGISTFNNVYVGGTITYEDVKNVDSVGIVTARAGVKIPDGQNLTLGSDGDIGMKHQSGHFEITNSTGNTYFNANGQLVLRNNQGGSVKELINGWVGVDLKYDNSTKLSTTSSGATVIGDITISDKIIHAGDTNTAIRFPADDTISFETGGSARAFINSAGDLTIGGSAGTLGKVYIKQGADTDTEGVTLLNSGGSNSFRLFLGDSSGAVAHLGHGGQKQFNINQAGKVGIGVANPVQMLSVFGNIYQRTGDVITWNNGDCQIGGVSGYHFVISTYTGSSMTEKLRVTSDGNIGINATSPNVSGFNSDARVLTISGPKRGILELRGSTQAADIIGSIRFFSANNNEAEITSVADGSYNGDLRFTTNGSERLRIHSTGVVQIGDSTASSLSDRLLQIGKTDRSATYLELRTSTSGTGGIVWSDNTSGDAGYRGTIEYNQNDDSMFFKTAATERLRINSSGYVGVKRSTPLANLHTTNNELALGANPTSAAAPNATYDGLVVDGEAGSWINIRSRGDGNSAYGRLAFSDNTRGRGHIEYRHKDGSGDDWMGFQTAGSERLRITSDGDVKALTGYLQAQDLKLGLAADRYPIIQRAVASSGSQSLSITGGSGYSEHTGSAHTPTDAKQGSLISLNAGNPTSDTFGGGISYYANGHTNPNNPGSGNQHVFYTRSGVDTYTERLRIEEGGAVLIGRTTKQNSDSTVEIQDATNTYVRITSGNTTGSTGVIFGTSDDHSTGGIFYDGSTDNLLLAGHNNTTRLTIASDGKVGINEVSNINGRLHVQHDAANENILYATRYNDQGNDKPILAITEAQMTGMGSSGLIIGNHNRDIHIGSVFDSSAAVTTGSTAGIRITSTGRTYWGTTSPIDGNCQIAMHGQWGASGCGFEIKNTGNPASNRDFLRFYNKTNGEAGSIEHTSANATAFKTSSDYRLKENIVDITDGIERLKLLKPRRFSWIEDPELGLRDGFIAHEVTPAIPHCVSGEKDAVDENGKMKTQQMEYSQLTPLLTAALQEAIAEIETLKAEVAALKSA